MGCPYQEPHHWCYLHRHSRNFHQWWWNFEVSLFCLNVSRLLTLRYSNWKWPAIKGLHDFRGTLCHTAKYDTNTVLDGKRVAVIGVGSSGIQVTANIVNKVSQLYTWIRSPTWITAGFAQGHAGPNGANFKCKKTSYTRSCPKLIYRCRYAGTEKRVCRESGQVSQIL